MLELLEEVCAVAVEANAEDIFLRGNANPRIRLDGAIREFEQEVSAEQMEVFWALCGASEQANKETDVAWKSQAGQRFRVNCFKSMGSLCAVLRPLKENKKSLSDLGLPEDKFYDWMTRRSGLVLVTGATGSGKSTSLSSALKWVAENEAKHIVTVEDPIEYLLRSDKSLVSQRQVGVDTESFSTGLRAALRQSPDVILVGEIRDEETAKTALHACETGHLVVSTLHSATVPETVERLVSVFPASEREASLGVLSKQLIGIMCQKLVPREGGGLCLLIEHMEFSGAIKKWVADGDLHKIAEFHQTAQAVENVRFIDSIMHFYKQGIISADTGRASCEDPDEFDRMMLGVGSGSR